jgi:hypothetical protein
MKIWPDPAHRKLATAAIIAVLAVPGLYLLGLWALIAEWLGVLWYFLAGSTLVPNWLLGLFAICMVIVAGMLGASLRPPRESVDPEKDEPTD